MRMEKSITHTELQGNSKMGKSIKTDKIEWYHPTDE